MRRTLRASQAQPERGGQAASSSKKPSAPPGTRQGPPTRPQTNLALCLTPGLSSNQPRCPMPGGGASYEKVSLGTKRE